MDAGGGRGNGFRQVTDPVRRVLAAALALAGLCFAGSVAAAIPYDPFYDWRTLETPHFRIHFKREDEPLAARAAVIAERAHARLARQMRWMPEDKTEVVLSDDYDLSNGYATPYPYNMMGLFVIPPEPGSALAADSLDQWLEDLIEHEYVHILHLDNAAGFPGVLRDIFGRQIFTFPNLFQPDWLIEGLATYRETDAVHGRGRGQGAEFAAYMRTEALNGVRPLRQVNVPNVSWPQGRVPYLYGVHFFQFLEARYGAHRVQEFVDAYSRNVVPFRVNGTARRVFGKDMYALWEEFETWLEARYLAELETIRAAGVVAGTAVTSGGFAARDEGGTLAVMPAGDVYFVRGDGTRRRTLVHRDAAGTIRELADLNPGARISVHAESGILIAQPEVCRERRVYYDVFLLRSGKHGLKRLTRCARYRDVAWHPDGEHFAAVRIAAGRHTLDLVHVDGRRIRTLAQAEPDETLAQPDWSPDGAQLVLVRTRRGDGGDLYRFEPETDKWQRLTRDRNVEFHPRHAPDGRHVLFTSDHGGVFNARRLSLDTGEIATLTNVETAAFYPGEAADGTLYFLVYGPLGYDVHVLPETATERPLPAPHAPVPPPEPVEPADYPVRNYSPWQTLVPRAWFPYFVADADVQEAGVLIFGQDVLGVHQYALLPAWDFTHHELVGTASYAWSDRLFMSLERTNDIRRNSDNDLVRVRRNEDAQAVFRVPFTRYDRAFEIYAGGVLAREEDLLLGAGVDEQPATRDDLYGIGFLYRNAQTPRLAISEQQGRRVKLIAERSTSGSDYRGDVYTFDWREYLHLGNTHVLALRYLRGHGTGAPRPFNLGGARGSGFIAIPPVAAGEPYFNERRYGLRGYPDGRPELTGRRMELATLEYRFPLAIVERGVMSPPVGLHRWSGNVFIDAGTAWNDTRPSRLHPGAGVEAVMDMTAGYRLLNLRLRIGYAHGFDEDAGGEDQVYLNLGASF